MDKVLSLLPFTVGAVNFKRSSVFIRVYCMGILIPQANIRSVQLSLYYFYSFTILNSSDWTYHQLLATEV